jgi:hypothetical protein
MPNKYVRASDGTTRSIPQDVVITFNYDILGLKTDNVIFIANCPMEVAEVKCMPVVAGTDGSAVTAEIKKASGTTATGSGTAVATATFDLKGTVYTVQTATLSGTKSVRELASGDRLGIDFTGTLTAAEGFIQVRLKRIQGAGSEK